MFWFPRKQITKKMNFLPFEWSKKGVLLDEQLHIKDHIDTLKQKLNRVDNILAKLRHYLSSNIIRTVQYFLFDTALHYACQVWGHNNSNTLEMVQGAQTKALRFINFKEERQPCEPLFNEAKILNLTNIITLNHLNSNYPAIFDD